MPWYGTTAPVANPGANAIVLDTGALFPGTATANIEVQMFVWTDSSSAILVEIQRVAVGGALSVMQRFPVISGWLYAEIHGLIPFQQGERIRVRTVNAVTGNVVASVTTKEVR